MVKRTLETDVTLWIVFVVTAVLGVVLDRVAPQVMAAWGWALILIALGAGLGALAWPLSGERAGTELASDAMRDDGRRTTDERRATTDDRTRSGSAPSTPPGESVRSDWGVQ